MNVPEEMKSDLLKANQLKDELDKIFNEYLDKIEILIAPYVKYVKSEIASGKTYTTEEARKLLSPLPQGFERSELGILLLNQN